MAQTFNPYGFSLVKSKESNPSFGVSHFTIADSYASSIAIGDPVTMQVTSNVLNGTIGLCTKGGAGLADKNIGGSTVLATPAATSVPIYGIFTACRYATSTQTASIPSTIWVGGTATYNSLGGDAEVNDRPFSVFKVMMANLSDSGVVTAYTAATSLIGQNFNFSYGNGANTLTKQSTAFLNITNTNISSAAVSVFAAFKVIELAPGSSWSDPYPEVYCIINNHYLKPGSLSRTN